MYWCRPVFFGTTGAAVCGTDLPRTGFDAPVLVLAALTLVLLGALLVRAGRRRTGGLEIAQLYPGAGSATPAPPSVPT